MDKFAINLYFYIFPGRLNNTLYYYKLLQFKGKLFMYAWKKKFTYEKKKVYFWKIQ